ncbi:MAG: hypothetical protein JW798_02665 [Prolixibacteraceae bacterium]|nr:hypothetical protein [Prolixibacteraceae bacterium]
MKSYILKRKKWYDSDFHIYRGNEIAGEIKANGLKNSFTVTIGSRMITILQKSIWKEEKQVFEEGMQIGTINHFSFKNYALLNFEKTVQLKIKQNIWKGIFTLESDATAIAECKTNHKGMTVTAGDLVDESILAALIAHVQSVNNSYMATASFIPLFIILFM